MKVNMSATIEEKIKQKAEERAVKDRRSFSEIVQFALEEYLE